MTEKERIEFAASILKDYGIHLNHNNEILPILMGIKDLEKKCIETINDSNAKNLEQVKEAVKRINNSQKTLQFSSPLQAFLHGFAKFGIAGILLGIAAIYYASSSISMKRESAIYLERQQSNQSFKAVNDSLQSLGYIKSVQIKEDEYGKYFILQSNDGTRDKKAGKDFEIVKQDGKNYIKVYTEFFNQ